MTGLVKSSEPSLLLLSFLLYIVDSHANSDTTNEHCGECTLQRNNLFSTEQKPIYQCMGCCFSRAYPTPLKYKQNMTVQKNITSEATCCVAQQHIEVQITDYDTVVKNHTACHCSTCYHHKQ